MTDSSEFSSLFALVENHLSKISLQDNAEGHNTIRVPPLSSMVPNGSVSESSLSLSKRLPPSPFNITDNTINTVLAEQLANMFKAKELKQKAEENERLIENMKQKKIEEEKNLVIDLMPAIQTSTTLSKSRSEENPSISSSCESLFQANFNEWNDEPEKTKPLEPLLPCIMDMSFLLKEKSRMCKPSAFGKVLCARMRPVAVPYLKTRISSNITTFAFDTPSPCDIIKEKRKKPTMSCSFTFNIHDFT